MASELRQSLVLPLIATIVYTTESEIVIFPNIVVNFGKSKIRWIIPKSVVINYGQDV